ncbi:MAG: peptide deformylase [Clostridiales bacterium]|nr:peptide deformylase [Clostridiales bacterium]
MAIRTILTDKDKALRKTSREVTDFNPRLHMLLDDMNETLVGALGVGLAAPQVGILRRVAIIKHPETGELAEFINPTIIAQDGEQIFEEGCLSVPGYRGKTKRPAHVVVKAFDRDGKEFEMEGEEVIAVAMCHEIDHLNGKLYTDIVDGDLWEVED